MARQLLQAKAAPIREGLIVSKQETTMQELQQFATVCKERFGIEAFQIHIPGNVRCNKSNKTDKSGYTYN